MSKLAIVGAGIGGCSAAYFARKYLPNLNVTIYDSQNRIGGRILTYNESGEIIELGAAFFNRFNSTLLGTIKAERLKIAPVEGPKDFAVWNGSKVVFRSNKQSFATNFNLLSKHQLSLARTFFLLRKVKGQVAKLYQEEQKTPADFGELFESAGLDKWHKMTFSEELINRGVSQAFIEIGRASCRERV